MKLKINNLTKGNTGFQTNFFTGATNFIVVVFFVFFCYMTWD